MYADNTCAVKIGKKKTMCSFKWLRAGNRSGRTDSAHLKAKAKLKLSQMCLALGLCHMSGKGDSSASDNQTPVKQEQGAAKETRAPACMQGMRVIPLGFLGKRERIQPSRTET